MSTPLSRHRVLVAVELTPAARARLSTFFDLHEIDGDAAMPGELAAALVDKAGLLVDDRCRVDAALLAHAPLLRAVASTEEDPQHVDLDALTRAGIRVTHTPSQPIGTVVDRAWEQVEASLRRADGESPATVRLRPAAGTVRLGAARDCVIAIEGRGVLHRQLQQRARSRGTRVLAQGDGSMVDVLVRTLPAGESERGSGIIAGESVDVSHYAAMLEGPAAHAISGVDPRLVAAEGLVAALGFGRHAWHPLYWLNPEVGCTTCC